MSQKGGYRNRMKNCSFKKLSAKRKSKSKSKSKRRNPNKPNTPLTKAFCRSLVNSKRKPVVSSNTNINQQAGSLNTDAVRQLLDQQQQQFMLMIQSMNNNMNTLLKATGANPSSIGNSNVNGNTVPNVNGNTVSNVNGNTVANVNGYPPNPTHQHPQAMEVCGKDDDDEKVNANNASLDLGNGIVLNFPLQK